MGKQLHRKHPRITMEHNNSGCMSAMLHILYFPPWHNVKRMLPHKRHGAGRHLGGFRSSKRDQNIPITVEAQEPTYDEVDKRLIEEKMSGTSQAKKKPSKARIKAQIAEETSKENYHNCLTSAFHAQLQLLRTDSIHHLEPLKDGCFEDMRENIESPRIDPNQYNASSSSASKLVPVILNPPLAGFCGKQCEECGTANAANNFGHIQVDELGMQPTENHSLPQDKLDNSMSRKYTEAEDLIREDLFPHSKEFLNVLEICQANEESFMKILHDRDSSLNIQISRAKRELTKSGSFPVAYISHRNNVRSSKVKDKLRDIESFTNQEGQSQSGSLPAKLTTSNSSDDTVTQSFHLMTDGNEQERLGTVEPGKVSGYSLGSSKELKNQGDNGMVKNHIKNIKQRIKHAIKGRGKEHDRISMDAVFHKIPSGRKHSKDGKKEKSGHWKELATDSDCKDSTSSYGSGNTLNALGKGGLHRLRRTASLNESVERYSQLFESTFCREAKHHLSDRLKLTNEDAGSPGRPAPKILGRIFSLPETKSSCSPQSEVCHDTSCLGRPTSIYKDNPTDMERPSQKLSGFPDDTENDSELQSSVENASQEILVEASESSLIPEDQVELIMNADDGGEEDKTGDNLNSQTMLENNSISHFQQEVEPAPDACIKQAQPSPNSVLDSGASEFIITEEADSGLKPRPMDFNELDSLVNLQDLSCMDSPYVGRSMTEIENVRIPSKHFDRDLPHIQVDKKDESNFNYVRDVLELAGFSGNGNLGTWHLPDQPVDPSLFEEVECFREETGSNFNHELLFDVINEVLIDIYDRSLMYWPKPLSTNLNIRPMPIGSHVLEEIWASISWFLRYDQFEPDKLLDDIAGRDLAKADGWMDLHFESECVALQLEEWIWDELLEEVILELELN